MLPVPILYLPLPKQMPHVAPAKRRPSLSSWWHDQVASRITLTGDRSFGYHDEQVTGDGDAFASLNYYGQGSSHFTDIGQSQVTGHNVLGVFNFDFQLADNRFGDPQGQHTSINYESHGFSADIGDIRGHLLNDNQFVNFSKTLKGVMFGYTSGKLEVRALRSNIKGAARTVSIQGTGSPGPYYLGANQIIQDSEQVQVDGQPMKLGQDYTMDYQVGTITFISQSIAQTSTITVSFEELGVNADFGTLQGAGINYSFGPFGKVGVTSVEQLAGGQTGLGTRTDLFQGYGAPSTPYFLQYAPLTTYPIIVQLDGLVQTAGVDYQFDTGNPTIFYFLRYVPATSTIEVTYTPAPTSTVNGDRHVLGYDYQLPFKGGLISYSQANGSLTNTPTPSSGTARGISFDYAWNKWKFHSDVRDMPQGFVGIETDGFNRNERATEWSLIKDTGKFQYSLSGSNDAISSAVQNADVSTAYQYGRTTNITASTQYSGPSGVGFNLSQSHVTSTALGSDTKLDLTSLSASKAFGKLSTQWTLQRTAGLGTLTDTSGNATEGSVNSSSIGLSAKYPAGKGWFVGGKYDLDDTESQAIHGRGLDESLSLGYHPSGGTFSTDFSYSLSRSGTLAALSQFSNGTGFGYDGGSFSSPVSGTGLTNGPTDSKITSLVSEVKLGSKARLNAHVSESELTGGFSPDTSTLAYGLGVQTDLGRTTSLAVSLEQGNTNFIGTTQTSTSTTLNSTLTGSLGTKWNYQLNTSVLLSSGGDYAQNSFAYDSSLSRRLSALERLTFQLQNGNTSGYQPQTTSTVGLSYSRIIFHGIALVGGYRIQSLNYLGGNTSTGGYNSKGFNVSLNFDFGR